MNAPDPRSARATEPVPSGERREQALDPVAPTDGGAGTPPGPRRLLARYWWAAGMAIAVAVAVLATAFASSDPDGLESVAIQQGFEDAARKPGLAILPDYAIPGIGGDASRVLAAAVGIVVVVLLVLVLGRVLARRRKGPAA